MWIKAQNGSLVNMDKLVNISIYDTNGYDDDYFYLLGFQDSRFIVEKGEYEELARIPKSEPEAHEKIKYIQMKLEEIIHDTNCKLFDIAMAIDAWKFRNARRI